MKNSELVSQIYSDEILESCTDNLTELNTMLIENAAQTAFNSVIFEAAISDEVIYEADEDKDKTSLGDKAKIGAAKAKAGLLKAIEAVKRFFANVCEKIKTAINKFIASVSANISQGRVNTWIKKYKAGDDTMKNAKVKISKDFKIDSPIDAFGLRNVFAPFETVDKIEKDNGADFSESTSAAKLASDMNKYLGNNYVNAKKELENVDNFADLNRIVSTLVSKCSDKDQIVSIADAIAMLPDEVSSLSKIKEQYKKIVDSGKKAIKDRETVIKNFKDLEGVDNQGMINKQKFHIGLLNKEIAFTHAAFIGYLKYLTTANSLVVNAIKSAKKGGVNDEVQQESFMGLALL